MLINLLIHTNIIFFVNQTVFYTKMGNIFFQRLFFKTNPLPEFPKAGFNRFKYLKLPLNRQK